MKTYREVKTSERLPEKFGTYFVKFYGCRMSQHEFNDIYVSNSSDHWLRKIEFWLEEIEQPSQPEPKYHLKCNKCSNTFWSSNPFPELQLCPVCNNTGITQPSQPEPNPFNIGSTTQINPNLINIASTTKLNNEPSQPVGEVKSAEEILDKALKEFKITVVSERFKSIMLLVIDDYHNQFPKVVLPSVEESNLKLSQLLKTYNYESIKIGEIESGWRRCYKWIESLNK